MTINKFAAFTNRFDEMREKLEKNKKDQEENKKGSFDNTWKFEPKLPENKPKIMFKVRILPNVHNTDATYPWISGPFHMYRKPDGKFLYTMCPTINNTSSSKTPCPICEKAKSLFDTQDKKDEDVAFKMYKKPRFFLNVLVVEDPRAGDQNQKGKVLVFEYGKKLQEKIEDAVFEQKIDICDPLAGHDLNLVIKRQGEFPSYDSSSFSIEKTAIADTPEEMNTIFDSIINIHEKIFARGPQTYEKIVQIMNSTNDSKSNAKPKIKEEVDTTESIDDEVAEVKQVTKTPSKPAVKPTVTEEKKAKTSTPEDDFDFDFGEDK